MKSIKRQYFFVGISIVIALVWIFIPETNNESEQGCYDSLMGSGMSYQLFNNIQFYYFIGGNFILLILKKKLNVIRFILIEFFLLIPVVIKLYIYHCSH